MNRKPLVYAAFVLFLSIILCFFVLTTQRNHSTKGKKTSYFVSIPITKFSPTESPCLNIKIGKNTISAELDLGFRGDVGISSDFIDQIPGRTFVRNRVMYGLRGKEYLEKVYSVPKVKIGEMAFINPAIQEYGAEFVRDSVICHDEESPSQREVGRVGWELFHNVNLLLDLANSRVAFCDSVDTLRKHGHSVDTFVKTALFIERGLVEFICKIPNGPLRCMLDTGSTWNMLHTDAEQTVEEMARVPDNAFEIASIKIGNTDFGPMTFHRVPLHLPINVEAVLGMEFIKDHLIFLDFSNRQIYIVP